MAIGSNAGSPPNVGMADDETLRTRASCAEPVGMDSPPEIGRRKDRVRNAGGLSAMRRRRGRRTAQASRLLVFLGVPGHNGFSALAALVGLFPSLLLDLGGLERELHQHRIAALLGRVLHRGDQ